MSKLKITENLFLEVNELNRFVEFLKDEGYKKLMKAIISSGGIVLSDDNSFKVAVKPNTIDSIIINPGLAFNEELEAIILDKQIEMQFINTGIKKWLIISRDVTNYEKGEVSISLDGTLSGVNTKFTDGLLSLMLSLVKCLKEITLTHIELKISTCVRDSLFQYIRNISLSANQILYH